MDKGDFVLEYFDVILGKEIESIDLRLKALVDCKRITADRSRDLSFRVLGSYILISNISLQAESTNDSFTNILKKYNDKLLQDALFQIKNYVDFTNGLLEVLEKSKIEEE